MFVLGKWVEHGWKVSLAVVLYLIAAVAAVAQSDANVVHVLPHSDRVSYQPRESTFRSNVDLVLVNVTVLDRSNRTVTGLASDDFSLLEDKRPQTIKYFSSDDQPLSLAIVLDASASMASKMEQARRTVLELAGTANPSDDVSLVVVGDKPSVELSFDDNGEILPKRLAAIQPRGRTALWDAMFLALDQMKYAHYQRRAMVVISDGGDNHSVYNESELKSRLEEADVQLYAVGLFDRFPQRNEERRGPRDLDELTSTTGGRLMPVVDSDEMKHAVTQINEELRNEYVIGYLPSDRASNAKWRTIKVAVREAAKHRKLRLYAKKGYYSAGD